MEDLITSRQIFLSLLNLSAVPNKSTTGKFSCIWYFQHIGINETKFEKMRIFFKVMFSLPSPSSWLKRPIQSVSVFCWKWRFFLLLWLIVYTLLTVSEKAFFQKRSPEWRFLKTRAYRFPWTHENGGFIIWWCHTSYSACPVRDGVIVLSPFHRFSVLCGRKRRKNLRVKKFGDTCGRGLISSHLTHFSKIHTCSLLQARLVQWWEHLPPTNVAWVRIPAVMPCVSRVCCSFSFSILA